MTNKRFLYIVFLLCLAITTVAQPVITYLEPPSAIPGTDITIYGANFEITPTSNIVTFNGVPATINSASTTTLIATVPSSSFGPTEIVISNANGTSVNVSNFIVLRPNSGGTFATPSFFSVGSQPLSIVSGDFNGDGHLDLATSNGFSSSVSIMIGEGNGSFGTASNIIVGTTAYSIGTVDFNNDGDLDLVTSNSFGDNVSILIGNGDGTFGTASNFDVGNNPLKVITGDFDGDGNMDLATANAGSDNVSILIGNGDGTFGTASNFDVGSTPTDISTGDFNGDGILDLVTANDDVSILIGNGDGTFGTATSIQLSVSSQYVVTGDFGELVAGDGNLDFATANYFDNVSIVLGLGDGTFVPLPSTNVGNDPAGIVSGDFNGDGILDLITANNSDANVSVLFGESFFSVSNFSVGSSPDGVTTGDFNGDGLLDLATANYDDATVSVLINQRPVITHIEPSAAIPGKDITIFGVTFDPDPANNNVTFGGVAALVNSATATKLEVTVPSSPIGPTGIVISNSTGTSADVTNFTVLTPNAGGTFGSASSFGVGNTPLGAVAADFDSDGTMDVATANFNSDDVSILLGNGDGSFSPATNFNSGVDPEVITSGDFDGDGIIDLATANRIDSVSILIGNGDGTFSLPAKYSVGGFPQGIIAEDFNSDGILDLATSNGGDDNVSVLIGNGDGTFGPATNFAVGGFPRNITSADYNGDGILDLATPNTSSNNISILFGNGDGNFGTANNFGINASPSSIATGDIDGDGVSDLVTVNEFSNEASILLGIGDGSFNATTNFFVAEFPYDVIAKDFDGDGILDLVTLNHGIPNISFQHGNGDGSFAGSRSVNSGAFNFILSADFDGDGILDLATANLNIFIGLNIQTDITSFTLPEQTGPAFIDFDSDSISCEVIAGTNITSLVPEISLSVGATVLPQSGVVQDFTNSVIYTVTADDGASVVDWTIRVIAVPLSPVLTLESVEQTSAAIRWDIPVFTDGFNLEISSDIDFASLLSNYDPLTVDKTITNENIDNLIPGTQYFGRLRSFNIGGSESINSSVLEILTKPATPVLDTITAPNISQTSASVSWPAIAGIVMDYQVEVSSNNFDSLLTGYPLTVTETSVNIGVSDADSLVAGTQYWARVRSRNASGESPNSNIRTMITKPATPILALPDSTEIKQTTAWLRWDPVSGIVDNYLVDVSKDGFQTFLSGFNAVIVADTLVQVTDLDEGTNYQVRIRAQNQSGASPNSDPANFLTIPADPAATPAATVTLNSFQATWTQVTGADFYITQVSLNDFKSIIFQDTVSGQLFADVMGLSANTVYKYRIQAGNTTGVSGFSNEVRVTTAINTSPLEISLTFDGQFLEGQDSSLVTISVSGALDNPSAIARHKGVLFDSFSLGQTLTVDINGDFIFIVSQEMLDEIGIHFEIQVRDDVDSVSKDGMIFRAFSATQSPSIPLERFGGTDESWNLFSIPYELDDKSISGIFTDYDPSRYEFDWKIMRYRNSSNDYVNFNTGQVNVGEAYWFNAIEQISIKTGAGQTNSQIPFSMGLVKGFNLIGNPYNVSISWNGVITSNGEDTNIEPIYMYVPGTRNFQQGDVIQPFSGGFVWAEAGTTVSISPIDNRSGARIKNREIASRNIDEPEWIFPIEVQSNKASFQRIAVGMHPEARELKDIFDKMTLPRFFDYLEMYATHEDYFYPWFSEDITATVEEHTWRFTMESDEARDKVMLSWDQQAIQNKVSSLVLVDEQEGRVINVKQIGMYEFALTGKRSFTVYYSLDPSKSILPSSIFLGDAYPNPATHSTIIPVTLPDTKERYNIELVIYNMQGQKVQTLVKGNHDPGFYEFSWEVDRESTPGIYLYRLSFEDQRIESVQKRIIIQR